jgi:hypothetical protein
MGNVSRLTLVKISCQNVEQPQREKWGTFLKLDFSLCLITFKRGNLEFFCLNFGWFWHAPHHP